MKDHVTVYLKCVFYRFMWFSYLFLGRVRMRTGLWIFGFRFTFTTFQKNWRNRWEGKINGKCSLKFSKICILLMIVCWCVWRSCWSSCLRGNKSMKTNRIFKNIRVSASKRVVVSYLFVFWADRDDFVMISLIVCGTYFKKDNFDELVAYI